MVSFFGVYDGHGGSKTSEWLRQNLHVEIAKRLYLNNTHKHLPQALISTIEEVEAGPCAGFVPGSCCTTVLVKGNRLYCATAGDSLAVIYGPDKKTFTKLNDRHGVETSPQEAARVRKANAVIDEKGALVARGDGELKPTKVLYPSRGFGDADFKEQVEPNKIIIATPTGVGVGYEGPAFELTGAGPYWLLVGCDGLWDFMKETQVTEAMFAKGESPQAMAEHLVRTAQAKPYSSYDDVTCIVCKIELPEQSLLL